jgi:hypothetical protein
LRKICALAVGVVLALSRPFAAATKSEDYRLTKIESVSRRFRKELPGWAHATPW